MSKENAEAVAKLLAAALSTLEDEPETASTYAQAAVHRAGRIGIVREIAGLAAYRAGEWATALRELRTHRRITGNESNLAIIADAERGLGRPEAARRTVAEVDRNALPAEVRVESAIVVSGSWRDQDDLSQARTALEIPELDPNTAFPYSDRLFTAYADVLEDLGDEAANAWRRRATLAREAWASRAAASDGRAPEGGNRGAAPQDDVSVIDLGELAE